MPKTLAELMAERGASQATVARAAGITPTAVHFYLLGLRSPNIKVARKIAAFFGVPVDQIIFPGELSQEPSRAPLSPQRSIEP